MVAKGFELEKWRLALVLTHCYPRLDENVSKAQNHLLKSPFCVHPKTGRVCVPIEAAAAADFNPMAVPTLRSLVGEINAFDKAHAALTAADATPDVAKTSLGPYMASFDKNFLDPLYRDIRR
jgi:DNA primase small subunit